MAKTWGKASAEADASFRAGMDFGVRFLTLQGGQTKFVDNWIRILPPHANMVEPRSGKLCWYWPAPVHYGVGPPGAARTIGCARAMRLGPCPVCELRQELKRQGMSAESNELRVTWNAYMNCIKLERKEDGTFVLADPNIYVLAVRRPLLDQIRDEFEEYGDLSDFEIGRNINIRRKGTDRSSTEFKVKVAPEPSPCLATDEMMEGLPDLSEITEVLEYDKAKSLLEGGASPDPFVGIEEPIPLPRLRAAIAPQDDEDDEDEEPDVRAATSDDQEDEGDAADSEAAPESDDTEQEPSAAPVAPAPADTAALTALEKLGLTPEQLLELVQRVAGEAKPQPEPMKAPPKKAGQKPRIAKPAEAAERPSAKQQAAVSNLRALLAGLEAARPGAAVTDDEDEE